MLFATTDKGAGAEVTSAGSADFFLVQVGTTVAPIRHNSPGGARTRFNTQMDR
jgi:hypothetical protein